ncbi:hypothetical protein GCM10009414_15200 [Tatumella terrea]
MGYQELNREIKGDSYFHQNDPHSLSEGKEIIMPSGKFFSATTDAVQNITARYTRRFH